MSARDEMRREYYEDVNNLASSIKEAYERGEIADRDSLIDHIHETVDGCARVIYTASAQEALLVSCNDSAGIDNLGADGFDWSSGIPWSQLAYFAVEADVMDALRDDGLDVNADFEVCDKHHKPYEDTCELCELSKITLPDGEEIEGELQLDADGKPRVETATCGVCGFEWNDALITSVTPAPAGRCPNEANHEEE